MSFLSVRRCAHVCHALVLAAVLLAGQRNVLGEVVAGAAAASQEAVDSKATGEASEETTATTCPDPEDMMEKARKEMQGRFYDLMDRARKEVQGEIDACNSRIYRMELLMEGLEATVERQDQVLEDAGGAKGIQQLREEAAAADKDATVAKETADSLAADKESLQRELDAATSELEGLRASLTEAESKESRAREEHAKTTAAMRGKLEKTVTELELAKKPRVVSMSAIYADLKELVNDLLQQTKDARDDIIQRALAEFEKVRAIVQPYVEKAVETSTPLLEKAMAATEPQRAKAGEKFKEYRGKFDESVGAPAAEKLEMARAEVAKSWQAASAKVEEVGETFVSKLVSAGASKDQAQKACKYLNIGAMCLVFGVFCYYLLQSILASIVWPVLRTVLRLALWLLKLPFRIAFIPVRLVLWVLTKCFRLVFGGPVDPSKGKGKVKGKGKGGKAAVSADKKTR